MSHSLEGAIGPFVIGAVVACFLAGIVSAQAFQYYVNFPNDRKLYKYCVLSLVVLDLAHTALSVWTVWDWCVSNYGNLAHLAVCPWSYGVVQVLLGLIALICRAFYSHRVYIISRRKLILPIVIMSLAVASLGCALGAAVTVFTKRYFAKFVEYAWGISTWLAIATLADCVITGSLVFYLVQSKAAGLHEKTNSIVNKLIELLVSTNLLTCIIGLVAAILFWTVDDSSHIAVNTLLPHFYVSALLVSLNARVELERRLLNSTTTSHHGAAESHGMTDLGTRSETTRTATVRKDGGGGIGGLGRRKRELRTALGFGAADVNLDRFDHYDSDRRRGISSIGAGIQVVTHQTVVTDGEPHSSASTTTYLATTPSSEKSVSYFNEKEEEEDSAITSDRGTQALSPPQRATHFARDLERT